MYSAYDSSLRLGFRSPLISVFIFYCIKVYLITDLDKNSEHFRLLRILRKLGDF